MQNPLSDTRQAANKSSRSRSSLHSVDQARDSALQNSCAPQLPPSPAHYAAHYSAAHLDQPPYFTSSSRQTSDSSTFYGHQPVSQPPWNVSISAEHSSTYSSAVNSPDSMAAPHTMRLQMQSLYQTPQSASPGSAHSADPSGRPTYGAPHQNMYFNPSYTMAAHSPYGMQHASQSHPSLSSQSLPVSYSSGPSLQPTPILSQTDQSPRAIPQGSLSGSASQMSLSSNSGSMNPNGMSQGHRGSTGGASSSAPGPIPATTPLVISQGQDGVQSIIFEYSRDRIKVPYTIRCNVESVKQEELTRDFKEQNCVYPRACNARDGSYKGNRLEYETQCNEVGWALAALNPELRGKRGLIQRAVDSWRNSASDPKLRSRRVRRLAKSRNRQSGSSAHGLSSNRHTSISSIGAAAQDPAALHAAQMQHNHHLGQVSKASGENSAGEADSRDATDSPYAAPMRTLPTSGFTQSPISSSNYDRTSATNSNGSNGGSVFTTNGGLMPRTSNYDEATLFADLRNITPRKSMTVKDTEHGSRKDLKLNILLEGGDTSLPPGWRDKYSVYPRSHKPAIAILPPPPTLMGSMNEPRSPSAVPDDSDDDCTVLGQDSPDVSKSGEVKSRTKNVTLRFFDDSTVDVRVPRMKRSRREREKILNELSHRMSWHRHQEFCDVGRASQPARMAFLQRCMDAYRRDIKSKFDKAPGGNARAPSHFEYRPGKQRWTARDMTKLVGAAPGSSNGGSSRGRAGSHDANGADKKRLRLTSP